MRFRVGLLVLLVATVCMAEPVSGIPYFARRYNVTCQQCHVTPPKLNEFGEAFVAAGYAMPGLRARRTVPIAVWLSGRSESLQGVSGEAADRVRAYLNRLELISGGKLFHPALSYFVEWRAVSQESRGNGTIRDRSGRFEDLFVTAAVDRAELTVGQFRQIAQVDVSRRLGLTEPLLLGSSLPGAAGGTARETSLRGFAPAGRSPAVRAAWQQPVRDEWRWTTSVGVPVPGEFSVPLNDEARSEASNEIEWRAKGVVVESFVRRGHASVGGHVFYDDGDRYLANGIATARLGSLFWTGIAGAARSSGVLRGQWSLETEYLPWYLLGFGARIEDRAADGAKAAFLPYVNAHFPGTKYTMRLTIERRLQEVRNATFIELGAIF